MVSISPYEWMQQGADTVAFVNEHQQTEIVVDPVEHYDAARLNTEQTILALDGEIF